MWPVAKLYPIVDSAIHRNPAPISSRELTSPDQLPFSLYLILSVLEERNLLRSVFIFQVITFIQNLVCYWMFEVGLLYGNCMMRGRLIFTSLCGFIARSEISAHRNLFLCVAF